MPMAGVRHGCGKAHRGLCKPGLKENQSDINLYSTALGLDEFC